MSLHAAAYDQTAGRCHHPVEDMEPDHEAQDIAEQLRECAHQSYLEASRIFMKTLSDYGFYILNHHDPGMAMWIVCYVLDLKPAWEKTCDEIARICGLGTRAAVNKEVGLFCAATGYSPAVAMKREGSGQNNRSARILHIIEQNRATETV